MGSVTSEQDRRADPTVSGEDAGGSERGGEDEAAPAPTRVARYDWDAATAAALSEDGAPTAAPSGGNLPKTEPDRLLEEIIREIVGDATAETVSSLQPPRNGAEPPAAESGPASTPETDSAPQRAAEVEAANEPAAHEGADTQLDAGTSQVSAPSYAADAAEDGERTADPIEPPTRTSAESTENGGAAEAVHVEYPSQGAEPAANSAAGESDDVSPADGTDSGAGTAQISIHHQSTAESVGDVSRETHDADGGTPLADQIADETRRRLALDEAVLPLPPATRVLTISNQKGGVGKTTSAVNLAAALARAGAHVLVIDLDPQGNASTALGVDHRSERQSVYEVLVSDLALTEVIQQSTEHERLDCVPATIHLAGAEIELVSLVAREQRLRRALDAHLATMERPYDYVFIDCPPSLGLLTINAFVAAREVLIPIQCEYYALEGLSQLLSNIELIEKHLNPDLRLSTILLTMYDSRTNLAQQVAQEVRDHFPTQTLETIIPRSVRVSEAPSYGQSVISYDFASSGSLSYREAAAEIARRGASESKETN